jgi:prophage antirepressor-like protein
MNALIDLENCRESMTISLNGVDHAVRLAGTIEEPYFCGKDICDILDHKDFKYALKTHVPLKYKKNYRILMVQMNLMRWGTNRTPPH